MKKGFTLIELLAVIVILAIIALIATPLILSVIEKSKFASAERSADGYVHEVENTVVLNELDNTKESFADKDYTVSKLTEMGAEVKGQSPTDDSWVTIKNGVVVAYSLKFGDYVVTLENGNVTTKKSDKVDDSKTKYGVTKVDATENDTHKGVIYLDPTNLSNVCTEAEASNNVNEYGSLTEVTTGCMKWYIYDDSGDTYKVILDHNTTAQSAYNLTDSNTEAVDANKALQEDIISWVDNIKETARLIEFDEVMKIINQEVSSKSSYYFDGESKTGKGTSKYAWLYDYTTYCENYGCNYKESNSFNGYNVSGYWTQTPVANTTSYAWFVNDYGWIGYGSSAKNYSSYGIRPVITISKSIVN